MKIDDLNRNLEAFFMPSKIGTIQDRFAANAGDETITLAEEIQKYAMPPSDYVFRSAYRRYDAIVKATPPCTGPGFASWTCCEQHGKLDYANTLLRAVAMAYEVESNGQPLSEIWWGDFNDYAAWRG